MSPKKIAIIIISVVFIALIMTSIYFFTDLMKGGKVAAAKDGDTVKLHYTGKLNDGTVFDSSVDSEPLEFTIGAGQVIPGFNDGVIGMSIGEKKTIKILAKDAYGPRDEELIIELPKSRVPENLNPQVGQRIQIGQQGGERLLVTVVQIGEDNITLDANHPLAGEDLTFDIELVEIE